MALNALGKLEVVFRFQDASRPGVMSAVSGLRNLARTATSSASQTRNAFAGAFPAIMAMTTLRQIGTALFGFVKPVMEFQDAIANLRAVGDPGDLGSSFIPAVSHAAKVIGMELGYETSEVVRAMTNLAKQGFAGQDAINAMVPSARLARVAGIDLAKAADLASVMTHVWGVRTDELQKSFDMMVTVSDKTRLSHGELVEVMTRASAGIAVARPNFVDFLIVMGNLRDVSASAAATGTNLRRSYEEVVKRFKDISGEYNVATEIIDQAGKRRIRPISQIMFDLAVQSRKTGKDISGSLMKTLGGTRAATGFLAMWSKINMELRQNGGNVEAARAKLSQFEQDILKASERYGGRGRLTEIEETIMQTNNLQQQMGRLSAVWNAMLIELGPSLALGLQYVVAVLIKAGKAVVWVGEKFGKLLDWMGPFGKLMRGGWAATAALGIVLGGTAFIVASLTYAGMMLANAFGFIFRGVSASSLALTGLTTKLSANTAATVAQTGANVALAESQALANAAQAAGAGAKVGQAAGGLATGAAVGRLAGLMKFGGPILMIATTLIPIILSFTDIFSGGVDDLDSLVRKGQATTTDLFHQLSGSLDNMSAVLRHEMNRYEQISKETPAHIDMATMRSGTRIIDAIGEAQVGEQWKGMEGPMREVQAAIQTMTEQYIGYGMRGEVVPPALRADLLALQEQQIADFMTYMPAMDKKTVELVEALKAQHDAIAKVTPGLEMIGDATARTMLGQTPTLPGAAAAAAEQAGRAGELGTGMIGAEFKADAQLAIENQQILRQALNDSLEMWGTGFSIFWEQTGQRLLDQTAWGWGEVWGSEASAKAATGYSSAEEARASVGQQQQQSAVTRGRQDAAGALMSIDAQLRRGIQVQARLEPTSLADAVRSSGASEENREMGPGLPEGSD